jgi:hypothetical protein
LRTGWKLIYIAFALLLICSALGQMQSANYAESDAVENPAFDVKLEDIERNISRENIPLELVIKPRSTTEIYLSLGVLVFGLILIILTVILALRKNIGWDQESTRVFTISLVITAGLFLITAGYSDQQTAPMFGLLGTIVGYLLGKSPPGEQSPKSDM